MTSGQHYAEGERLLNQSWNNTGDIEVATLLAVQAHAHFTAALAYDSIETIQSISRNSALRRAAGPSA